MSELLGLLIAVAWVALVFGGVAWIGVRLRRRAIRRGTIPYRDPELPWYLGGVPKIDGPMPPDGRERER
jgi:hypothetical protein